MPEPHLDAIHLQELLAHTLSGAAARVGPVVQNTIRIVPESGRGQVLELRVRGPGDLELAYFVPEKRGSPFEQVFAGPPEEASRVISEAVRFVRDLVSEQTVLAWRPGLRGGRTFVRVSELSPIATQRFRWVVSWGGTHDCGGKSPAA